MRQPFDFVRPADLQEALERLAGKKPGLRPIAGGTDVVPGMHQASNRFTGIETLIDIHHLPELTAIRETEAGLSIGAAVPFSAIRQHPLINTKYPLLAKAVSTIGSLQIRNRATIGGNFVNNAPCADSVPPLLVYEAIIKIQSVKKKRKLSLENLLLKPYQTQLQSDEMVTEIILPEPHAGYYGDFSKLGRRRGVAISRITLALLVKIEDQIIEDMRIASGAVTPIGVRFPDLESFARGQKVELEFLKELSQKLGERVFDKTGLRWSTAYKLPVTQQMFYQLLHKVCFTGRAVK